MKRAVLPIALGAGLVMSLRGQEPPGRLPPSVAGGSPIVPAAGLAAPERPGQAPIRKFDPLPAFPPETVQAVYGMRTAAEWLARRQQPHGRFLVGVNPALKTPLDGDTDERQAAAAWAVCAAARFCGDDKLTAVGGQAVLTLLANCPDDPADPTSKKLSASRSAAAALALAIFDLPTADARLLGEAHKLCVAVRKGQQPDGSFPGDDPAGPGLAVQAMVASLRAKPDPAVQAAALKGVAFYRQAMRAKPHPVTAGAFLAACVECVTVCRSQDAAAAALETADGLCSAQVGKSDLRFVHLAGGFRPDDKADPNFESAHAARGLAAACQLVRTAVPDLTRYQKYRAATTDALDFVRGLQYTADNTAHFEGQFRAHYLVGGVHLGPADGTIRADATGYAAVAFQRFLESGAADKR